MSRRLTGGGRLLNRVGPIHFTFNGQKLRGFSGDTLASALLANGQMLMGRSFKYHRARGVIASGAEEPNALMGIGVDGRFEPNQRATTTELFRGLVAQSQNHWPSLEFDVGKISNMIARFLPAGFYYKTFMAPRAAWKHLFEPIIRMSAGLGRVPKDRDDDTYEHFYVHTDVLIVGGGIAGLQAALAAGASGAQVLLVEQTAHWGGRAPVDGVEIAGMSADEWIKKAVETLGNMPNCRLRNRSMASGVFDHGLAMVYERLSDHSPGADGPRHRLWRIRAKQIVTATGALERPLAFAGNDVPGVMLASAVRDYAVNFGVSVGARTVVVTNNDDAYLTAIALKKAGLGVPAILDARPQVTGALAGQARDLGIRVEAGMAIGAVNGGKCVTGVRVCAQTGKGATLETIACDAVAMSGGWSPVVHLWSHCGGKLTWDENNAHFRPDPKRPPTNQHGQGFVKTAGCASGAMASDQVLKDANAAGQAAAKAAGFTVKRSATPKVRSPEAQPMAPVWIMPQGAGVGKRNKMWLDFQNDVKVSDVQLAAREGYESVEHTKRYTTLGMATDQGKLSNINGLAVLADALNNEIPKVGTTTFRPPYTPISMGSVAGEARGDLFQPIRKTPMHDWNQSNGAHWEPVGQWRRVYCYQQDGETVPDAINREVLNTRQAVGLLDSSTLGKIIVRGRDAGKFLDMLYTNKMSTLAPGKCRYGLMCNENGFLIDDGVVARLDKNTWLCHTTTGGAETIHGHMEDWLQNEWWDWQVYTANITEQFAQIAVVGPNARKLLDKIGGMDLSAEKLPFMQWADGEIGGIGARVFRISFSGELSYEIAVPSGQGLALWEMLVAAGQEFGLMPYGTEALHVLRAEKGFIIVGDESDGTVIPQDLGLHWALSKKKTDYMGKRAQQRTFMNDAERWQLVGLETLDGSVIPEGAYAVGVGENANGQSNMIGRVTSTYYSPTLERGIAMGLVQRGSERMGEDIEIPTIDGTGKCIRAKIVDPVFYDKEGTKQNV